MATKADGDEKTGKLENDIKCRKTLSDSSNCKYFCMYPNNDGTFTILSSEETLSEEQAKVFCRRCNLEDGFLDKQ